MSEIDWRDVARRMDQAVGECCGCDTAKHLTQEERDALDELTW